MNPVRWDTCHCLILLAASFAFVYVNSLLLFIIPASISFMWLFFSNHNEFKKFKPYAGLANWATLIRLITVFSVSLTYEELSNLQIACWLGLAISLDGLDGYLARKRGEQTIMGAYFDMETDVLFVCIGCCMLFVRYHLGYGVLILGFFRYFYVFIVWLLGLYSIKEQKTRIGPVIAVFVFISITLSFIIPDFWRKILINTALSLVVISFSYSFWLLLKKRKRT